MDQHRNPTQQSASALAHSRPTSPIPARRAVVIDDDPEVRALHRQVLDQLGFEVVLTTNGPDGLEAVREFSPTITFLDVSMPGMDGFATAARIRELSDTYILMVSGLGDEIDVVQGLGSGADDYVLKPFRPRELRARVEALLRRPRTRQAPLAQDEAEQSTAPWAPEPGLWSPGSPAPSTVSQHVPVPSAAPTEPTPLPAVRPTPVRSQPEAAPTRTVAAESRPLMVAPSAGSNALAVVTAPEVVADVAQAPAAAQPPQVDPDTWLQHGRLALHPGTAVALADGATVELDEAEVALLASLLATGTRVRSIANLVLALRGEGYVTTYFVNDADKRAVTDHMESLRRKLGDTGPTPRWIEPVRAVGFRMTAG